MWGDGVLAKGQQEMEKSRRWHETIAVEHGGGQDASKELVDRQVASGRRGSTTTQRALSCNVIEYVARHCPVSFVAAKLMGTQAGKVLPHSNTALESGNIGKRRRSDSLDE